MDITYRDVDFDSERDCELLSTWNNDPVLKHLYNRFVDEKRFGFVFTPAHFKERKERLPTDRPYRILMVIANDIAVGHATFQIDWPNLLSKEPKTAWLALMIGVEHLRGCGHGKRILVDLETLATDAGAARIEIGVFEYNERALGFFTSHGYDEFTRLADRTWWNGQLWSEVRLEKSL